MKLICPACAAIYQLPDGRVPPGALVRCVKCTHEWVPELPPPVRPSPTVPPPSETVAEPVLPDAPQGFPEPSLLAADVVPPPVEPARKVPASPARRMLANPLVAPGVAWAASLLLLVGLGWAVMHWQDSVVRTWPASQHAYAMLGR